MYTLVVYVIRHAWLSTICMAPPMLKSWLRHWVWEAEAEHQSGQLLGPALADAMKGGAIVRAMHAGVLVWSCQPDF